MEPPRVTRQSVVDLPHCPKIHERHANVTSANLTTSCYCSGQETQEMGSASGWWGLCCREGRIAVMRLLSPNLCRPHIASEGGDRNAKAPPKRARDLRVQLRVPRPFELCQRPAVLPPSRCLRHGLLWRVLLSFWLCLSTGKPGVSW